MSRQRFVYKEVEPGKVEAFEVGVDYTGAERRAPMPTEAVTYSNARATDGTDLSSRRKHAEYLKRNNLAMYSDFEKSMPKLEQERREQASGARDTKERKQLIYDSIQKLKRQRK